MGTGEGQTGFGTFWLIVGGDGARPEVFTLGDEGGTEGETRTLPVFSFEEEALLFLHLGGLGDHWRASETDAADLATNLATNLAPAPTGAYRAVQRVVLDPFPDAGLDGFCEAVSLRRRRFVDLLTNPR